MMPNEQRPLKVFLCHASLDKPKVRELYRYLRRRGIKPWFDEMDLVGGQDWQVEIPKALVTSDAIIICLTKNSVDKEGYIQKEIKYAMDKALEMPEGRIFLIPVRFEECEVPFTLSRYQWVDLFDEPGYSRMMRALKYRASQLRRVEIEVSSQFLTPELKQEDDTAVKNPHEEKPEHEATEKDEREKAEKAAQKELEREIAEKARLEEEERKTTEKAEREKAKRENAKRRATQIAALKGSFSRFFNPFPLVITKGKSLLRSGSILGTIVLFFLAGLWAMPKLISMPDFVSTTTTTPTPTLTPTPSKTSTVTLTQTSTLTPTPSEPFPYTIQEGDSLDFIAERFNLGPDGFLLIWNQNQAAMLANSGIIYVGQTIEIPPPGTVIPTTTPIPANLTPGTRVEYQVLPGDTLAGIAVRFNSRPEDIIAVNNIEDANALQGGQLLEIPVNLVTATATLPPTSTPITPTQASTIIANSLPTEIIDSKGVTMELVAVYDFYMDKYEITNALYKRCVDADICLLPKVANQYVSEDYENYPVTYVDQNMASTYCVWRGARLPTEAEWMSASTNAKQGCEYANLGEYQNGWGWVHYCVGSTTPVGSYELGKSSFNIYDLIGNVREWIKGASSGKDAGVIGGSYTNENINFTTKNSTIAYPDLGFRCARDANP